MATTATTVPPTFVAADDVYARVAIVLLPPIHRDVLLRRGKQPPEPRTLDQETALQQIFTSDRLEEVIDVPLRDIVQLPPSGMNVSRLVLCAKFAASGEAACANRRCRRVHAVVAASVIPASVVPSVAKAMPAATAAAATAEPSGRHRVHVNYAWRTADAVTYLRYAPGTVLSVAPPNADLASDVIDSSMALQTKALESTRRPLTHCAHYYFNRTCNLGPECRFIHAIYIDPHAKKHQRAPAPAIVHTGRIIPAVPTTPHTPAHTPAPEALRTPASSMVSRSYDHDYVACGECEAALRRRPSPLALAYGTPASSYPVSPANGSTSVVGGSAAMSALMLDDAELAFTPPSPGGILASTPAMTPQVKVYRHDPYSWTQVRRPAYAVSS